MDSFLRYRNAVVLVAALFSQLILLGYQVRREDGGSLLETWTIGILAPVNQLVDAGVDSVASTWRDYVWLVGARNENEELHQEVDRLRLENQALERELGRVERSSTLVDYQAQVASKTLLAQVVGGGASGAAKEIIIDKGSDDGVLAGMAAITSEGIVGRVQSAHAVSALVVLINDADAAVGAVLEDTRVRGVLQGMGGPECRLNYIGPEVPVRLGETVYTSGADRIFPKGLPIGAVVSREQLKDGQNIAVKPFAKLDRLDEVLVVVEGVHQALPQRREVQQPARLLPPPVESPETPEQQASPANPQELDVNLTDADRLRRSYESMGAAQGYTFPQRQPEPAPAEPAAEEAVQDEPAEQP